MGGCAHRGCSGSRRDSYLTWPNLVTSVRTAVAVVLVLFGVWRASPALLFCGLAAYWLGDIADGMLARRTGAETRTGAVLDVVGDRLCVAVFYLAYVHLHHEMLVPVAVFLLNFMFLDTMLSLSFLNWPLLSTNYFYLVDRRIYLLNWAPVAKAMNTGLFLVVMVGTRSWWATLVVAGAQLGLKVCSAVLLVRLRPVYQGGCARPTDLDTTPGGVRTMRSSHGRCIPYDGGGRRSRHRW